ncbi:MAG: hypothetical protein FWH11_08130 [Micrococcales bacterium]|nr:hypothetical protein [Micrococcales bacterium]
MSPTERLQEAQARLTSLASAARTEPIDWNEFRSAQQEVLTAERELAETTGDEYAVPLDLGMAWSTGAPVPHVLASGRKAYVLFYLHDPDPDWDGTWTRVVQPGSPEPALLGTVTFRLVHAIKFGGPNDEALEGHPLAGKGLQVYSAHRVVNSRWITAEEQVNSVHPQHRGGWHDRLNHYVLCFHDQTLECLAEGFTTKRHLAPPRTVLSELANQLVDER